MTSSRDASGRIDREINREREMDAAFKTAKYPAYTTAQLKKFIAEGVDADDEAKMTAEIERRAKRDAGDTSVMTPSERLRNL
jgi:hypothetical protein